MPEGEWRLGFAEIGLFIFGYYAITGAYDDRERDRSHADFMK